VAQEKWLIDSPKIIDFENIRNLKVSLVGGQVNIIGHDEPGARVEIHSVRGKSIKVSVVGDTLEIDHPQLSWDNFIEVFKSFTGRANADISIMVPHDINLKFGVVTASALITGLKDDARISTVSGDLVVDDMEGNVELNSVSGEIGVRAHRGSVAVHTVSGDVTASGAIERFSADGVSGTVFLDITGVPDEIRVNTVSGSVTARLESGVAAQYRISTVSGRIQLDEEHITGVRGQYTGRYGELDKPWLDFRANTVSGGISVLHAVTA
jgi:hypothetical protein